MRLIRTLMVVVVSLWSVMALADNQPLPDYSDPSRALFSQVQEQSVGKQYMQYLRSTGMVIDDPIDVDYINALGQRLVKASGNPKLPYYFFFMADPNINAFAGPGGYIAVNAGLVLAAQNEDEVAAVLAHEIAHVSQGHIARKIADASKTKYATAAGVLASIALGAVSGQAAQSAMAATLAGTQQHFINFSRGMEAEADRVGIRTLANAGFDPSSMPRFFTRMQADDRYSTSPPAILSDHPLTPERIADANARVAQFPKTIPDHSSLSFWLIRERLRVFIANDLPSMMTYYQKNLAKPGMANDTALNYGYALTLFSANQFKQSVAILQRLVTANPNQPILQLALADALQQSGDVDSSLKLMASLYQVKPTFAVSMQYGAMLVKAGQAPQGLAILRRYQLDNPNATIPYGLLAEAQAKSGRLADAYQTRARYLESNGDYRGAVIQLKMGLKLPKLDVDTKARLQAQMQELQSKIQQKS